MQCGKVPSNDKKYILDVFSTLSLAWCELWLLCSAVHLGSWSATAAQTARKWSNIRHGLFIYSPTRVNTFHSTLHSFWGRTDLSDSTERFGSSFFSLFDAKNLYPVARNLKKCRNSAEEDWEQILQNQIERWNSFWSVFYGTLWSYICDVFSSNFGVFIAFVVGRQ